MTVTAEQKRALQITFEGEAGYRPDGRWSFARLNEELTLVRNEKAARKAAQEKREREEQEARQRREARIAARGAFEDYAKVYRRSDDDNDARLARAVGWAVNVLASHEEKTAKLAKEFANNPAYALSWGMEYFAHAANYQAANELKALFEGGATVEGMIESFKRDVMFKATSPARSTSPTSNLQSEESLRASAKIMGYLDGSEYF